jgi:hypothetical protein
MEEFDIDSLYDTPSTTERKEKAVVALDWEKKESVRYRTNTLPGKGKIVIRHWIDGVGYVACGQKPGKITKEVNGVKTERLTLWTKDRDKNVMCEFCQERTTFRKQLKAQAVKEGRDDLNKEESAKASKLHKRQIDAYYPSEYEVRNEEGEVVRKGNDKAVKLNVIDCFIETQSNKGWDQMAAISKVVKSKKKVFTDYWYILDSKGNLQRDDEVTKDEKKNPIEVDLSFLDTETKSYKEGLAAYKKRKAEGNNVESLEDEEENVEPEVKKEEIDLPSFDEDEIVF